MNFNSDLTSKRRWSSAATSCDSSPARTFKSWSPRKLRDCNRLYLTKFPNLNPSQFSICNLYNLYIYIYINYNHRITVITYQCIIIYMESSCTNLHGASSTCFHGVPCLPAFSFVLATKNTKADGRTACCASVTTWWTLKWKEDQGKSIDQVSDPDRWTAVYSWKNLKPLPFVM